MVTRVMLPSTDCIIMQQAAVLHTIVRGIWLHITDLLLLALLLCVYEAFLTGN